MKKKMINISSYQLLNKVKIKSLNIIGTIVDVYNGPYGETYYVIEETFEDGSGELHYSIKETDLILIK